VGIVGCSGAGRAHYWRFSRNPNVEVVAVFDPNLYRLRGVKSDHPGVTFPDRLVGRTETVEEERLLPGKL